MNGIYSLALSQSSEEAGETNLVSSPESFIALGLSPTSAWYVRLLCEGTDD
jgi:hypothetical protein